MQCLLRPYSAIRCDAMCCGRRGPCADAHKHFEFPRTQYPVGEFYFFFLLFLVFTHELNCFASSRSHWSGEMKNWDEKKKKCGTELKWSVGRWNGWLLVRLRKYLCAFNVCFRCSPKRVFIHFYFVFDKTDNVAHCFRFAFLYVILCCFVDKKKRKKRRNSTLTHQRTMSKSVCASSQHTACLRAKGRAVELLLSVS